MQGNVYFAARYNCILNYLSIPVIVLGGVANVLNLRIFHCDLAYIWCKITIPRIFRYVCNCKEIIRWKLDEIVKTVNYFSNFVVPNRTFRVSFFHLSSAYCIVQRVAIAVFVETVLSRSSLNDVLDDILLLVSWIEILSAYIFISEKRFYSLGIRQIRQTQKKQEQQLFKKAWKTKSRKIFIPFALLLSPQW